LGARARRGFVHRVKGPRIIRTPELPCKPFCLLDVSV
jgi:hypothetical protein